jgi:putative tricarboxylic transport membrane protein
MKLNSTLSGLLVLIVGLAIAAQARSFPSIGGQSIGPAFFPTIIGAGFLLCGLALIVSGRRSREPWIEAGEWTRRPRMVFNFLLVFADLVFYAFAVSGLGFLITAIVFLSVLMIAFKVPPARIVPLALAVTLVMHYAFYTLLRVPLPWGVLEAVAW